MYVIYYCFICVYLAAAWLEATDGYLAASVLKDGLVNDHLAVATGQVGGEGEGWGGERGSGEGRGGREEGEGGGGEGREGQRGGQRGRGEESGEGGRTGKSRGERQGEWEHGVASDSAADEGGSLGLG